MQEHNKGYSSTAPNFQKGVGQDMHKHPNPKRQTRMISIPLGTWEGGRTHSHTCLREQIAWALKLKPNQHMSERDACACQPWVLGSEDLLLAVLPPAMAVLDRVLAAGRAHPLPPLFHHLPASEHTHTRRVQFSKESD
jgi:hypothetical protein